jgi:hypothetical protein
MTGKGGEPANTERLQFPMVDLFTGGMIMPLMFVNVAASCYLLSLTAPLAIMEAWKKALETTDGTDS